MVAILHLAFKPGNSSSSGCSLGKVWSFVPRFEPKNHYILVENNRKQSLKLRSKPKVYSSFISHWQRHHHYYHWCFSWVHIRSSVWKSHKKSQFSSDVNSFARYEIWMGNTCGVPIAIFHLGSSFFGKKELFLLHQFLSSSFLMVTPCP